MKTLTIIGAVSALLSVILGAFASHGLKAVLDAQAISVFETGVRYQMYHALAILLLPAMSNHARYPWLRRAGWFFVAGTVLFSGSLYALTLTSLSVFGPVTPLGGVCFMLGWGCLITALAKGTDQ